MNKTKNLPKLGNSNFFVCLGAPYHLDALRSVENSISDSVYWTIKRTAKPGDKAIFYLTSPIAAIVGFGEISEAPTEEPQSEWREKFFTSINRIRIFDETEFILRREILTLFPEWRFFMQPRQSVMMPAALREPFWELLNERARNFSLSNRIVSSI